jgi:ubiquinone/menaquinone biosynthesis C-methylase UbiE
MENDIPPEVYNKEYFLSDSVEGYKDFLDGSLSYIKNKLLNMLSIEKGIHCFEVGVGRGEFLRQCAMLGARVTGIDYSKDAIDIAKETLGSFPGANIQIADARNIPFDSDSFDRVFAGDVIEHLSFEDGVLMLKEMYRILKPGCFLLIHTSPNTIFTKFVYPLAKPMLKLISRESIKTLESHQEVGSRVHVHEYNLFTLRKVGKKAGLTNFRAWIDRDILRSGKHRLTQKLQKNPLIFFAACCSKIPATRFFLGNDLYLKCSKQ